MTRRPDSGPHLAGGTAARPRRADRTTLSELAYERLEEMIVSCVLRPGQFLSIQDLQERTRIGRTPIHQAVSRLAADTLIHIRPRHGLQIAAIELARDRTLLLLRREMERFVVRLATERATAAHHARIRRLSQSLSQAGGDMTIGAFNQLDLRIDQLLIEAAGEAFLANTLRPLHTIFRRVGYIYHRWVRPEEGLGRTIDCHLAVLDAVAAGAVDEAVEASDRLIAFNGTMFDQFGHGIDPGLLDCSLDLPVPG